MYECSAKIKKNNKTQLKDLKKKKMALVASRLYKEKEKLDNLFQRRGFESNI